jgi:hypothetical protein
MFKRSNVQALPFSIHTYLPTFLYLLSTLMFAIVNLARGYTIAGLVGLVVLLAAGLIALAARAWQLFLPGLGQTDITE